MLIDDVRKLPPLEVFLYWIRERHQIHLRRREGLPRPWTDDAVLKNYFFTNPYRENDKTTVWFRENIRDPLNGQDIVLFATVAFRWFNRIQTGMQMDGHRLLTSWREADAIQIIQDLAKATGPVFTGAYMIKAGNGPHGCKIPNVCKSITRVWNARQQLVDNCRRHRSLRRLWDSLCKFPNLGGFMSYEIVCDLRYTHLLQHPGVGPIDVDTWANPGPGAMRGLARLKGHNPTDRQESLKKIVPNPLKDMQGLLKVVRARLPHMPHFELREIEHSLCETDKYMRALDGVGKMKRRYDAH